MNLKGKSSKDMVKLIEANGWFLVHTVGDHRQYKHKTKPGKVTIPHPNKDIPIKTVKSILKQAGLL
ncbi:type II toxin-antitoxin system HicA family toxin [Paenibacillus luteus]|uniref:type II toxin-antitoxin system HicA family toxin n=1 Tax=Paenibacillus luteus TaxID=2545753 RepID=UPI0011431122|nr:type II toxin-antitoxin system HicA family toxin [Paenibacillus luteus]